MPLGIDIVKISRIQKLIENKIPKKIFSDDEIEYISSKIKPAQTAAGIFAAKEALLKAIGAGISSFNLNEISVLHNDSQKPYISLSAKAEEYAKSKGYCDFELSISHDGEYAAAVVNSIYDKPLYLYSKAVSVYKDCAQNVITPETVRHLLPKRKSNSHKGSYGRVYVLAGSVGMTGAAVMACEAVLKCGAGLITLGCAKSLNSIFEISLKEVMTKPVCDTDGIINSQSCDDIALEAEKSDVILIGPGLGKSDGIFEIVSRILSAEGIYAVIDADGLNAISRDISCLKGHLAEVILTPHIGEFSRLTGIDKETILSDTVKYAVEFAKEYKVTLVLKSHKTVVADKDGNYLINISGNPGMATGGTGDVLSGAITSFAAQNMKPFDAAAAGVYIHSLAADMAAKDIGEYSLTPSDILKLLPYAVKFSSGR